MKINQRLLVFIPKIPASLDTDTEQSIDYIKQYLISTFLKNKIGVVNDVILTLIDKRDKTKNYYSCILIFKKWFESEYVEEFQQSMRKRTAKLFLNKEEFFYIYPQYHLKTDTLHTITSNSTNPKVNTINSNVSTTLNNNSTQTPNPSPLVPFNFNDLVNVLVAQKNLLLAVQQDVMYYFKTLESNIETLRAQVDYNISSLRQEQSAFMNSIYNSNQPIVFTDNPLNNNYTYYGNFYENTPNNNYWYYPQSDIYNRKYTIDLDEQSSWDDSKPIESIQRKRDRNRNRNKQNQNNNNDMIDQLRSNHL